MKGYKSGETELRDEAALWRLPVLLVLVLSTGVSTLGQAGTLAGSSAIPPNKSENERQYLHARGRVRSEKLTRPRTTHPACTGPPVSAGGAAGADAPARVGSVGVEISKHVYTPPCLSHRSSYKVTFHPKGVSIGTK
jgi:hypothetical protein